MEHDYKELAKTALGFQTVPFYVVVNAQGDILQRGKKRDVDFDNIPGVVVEQEEEEQKEEENVFCLDDDF